MIKGSCLCGQVKYEINGEMGVITHCHCPSCQKAHASAFSSVAAVQLNDLVVTAGEELLKHYESSPGKKRYFCSNCGSQIYARREDQGHYIFRMGTIDGDPGTRPAQHIFTRYKAPWYNIHDDIPEFPEWAVETSTTPLAPKGQEQLYQSIMATLTQAVRQETATSLLLIAFNTEEQAANNSEQAKSGNMTDRYHAIKNNVRDSDDVEQINNISYAVLLRYTDANAAIILAERICNCIKRNADSTGSCIHIGAATLHPDQLGKDTAMTDEIIRMGEKALLTARGEGFNNIVHYNDIE